MTVKEASVELGVTPNRVLQMIEAGILEAKRNRSRWDVLTESVEVARTRKTRPGPTPYKDAWPDIIVQRDATTFSIEAKRIGGEGKEADFLADLRSALERAGYQVMQVRQFEVKSEHK